LGEISLEKKNEIDHTNLSVGYFELFSKSKDKSLTPPNWSALIQKIQKVQKH